MDAVAVTLAGVRSSHSMADLMSRMMWRPLKGVDMPLEGADSRPALLELPLERVLSQTGTEQQSEEQGRPWVDDVATFVL